MKILKIILLSRKEYKSELGEKHGMKLIGKMDYLLTEGYKAKSLNVGPQFFQVLQVIYSNTNKTLLSLKALLSRTSKCALTTGSL